MNRSLMYTEQEKIDIILGNIVKMLRNRKYEKADGTLDNVIDNSKPESKGDNVWIIEGKDGNTYAIKIVFQNITTNSKTSPLYDFIENHPEHFRIMVATGFKSEAFLTGPKSQVFLEYALMQDLASYYLQPKFIKLSSSEKQQMMDEYNVQPHSITKIGSHDPMYKYFNMKKGDIYKVIRDSPASGQSIGYRIAKN